MAEHIERFAPSPTGPLHLGHAFSALTAWDAAVANHGKFLLRIEDIDKTRCRPEWEAAIYEDLHWLGIRWEEPVMRQSERLPEYQKTLQELWDMGLIYPCTCTRRDIELAAGAPQEGVETLIYPGTCRDRYSLDGKLVLKTTLRLDMHRAVDHFCDWVNWDGKTPPRLSHRELDFHQSGRAALAFLTPSHLIREHGDIVLARRDIGTSYHLSVVIDDAAQGVTHVTRGQDLEDSTKIHVLLQNLLGLPTPIYHHHRLIRDETGKRLAKRDDARALSKYRAEGATPDDIRRMVGL